MNTATAQKKSRYLYSFLLAFCIIGIDRAGLLIQQTAEIGEALSNLFKWNKNGRTPET